MPPTPPPAATSGPDPPGMAPVVNRILIFFYLLIWVSLLGTTWGVVAETRDGNYTYLVPAGLYMLILVGFFWWNRQYRGGGGSLSHQMWGYDKHTGRQIGMVLLTFALIAWMAALAPAFTWLYFALCGQTMGMFRWRLAVPLVILESAALAIQSGLLAEVLQPDPAQEAGLIGSLIGIGFFFLYAVLVSILLKSQVRSTLLVQELQATKLRLEEALAKEKEVAVLRERDRMAREMHDVLGHALALVAVKIEAAQRLQARDPARAAAELEATKALVRESMADLRASLANLRSPALEADDQPLGAALRQWATRTAQEGGFSIGCDLEAGIDSLPAPIQDTLWRVGREAILNVVQHARARHVELHVFCKDEAVYLSVADDGVGIPHLDDGQARLEVAGHYGIRGMRERLETLGGRLAITPHREGHGTLVLASVPLPPPAESPAQRIRDRLSPAKSLRFRKS